MTETLFTPGEWYVSGVRVRLGDCDWHKIDTEPGDGSGVTNIALVGFNKDTGEGLSDARLFAASKDLYEALEASRLWISETLDDIGGCDHSVGICCCADYALLERIDQVLSRARGESSNV